jgi:DNA-binding response OmpR family regulator
MPTTGAILVVDDDPVNRLTLTYQLEAEGHTVSAASDGREALALLRSSPIDVVLLDLVMPVLDGFGVLAELRGDPTLRDVPVIMISASDEIESVVQGIEMGAVDYLPKPANPTLLRARIDASLEKKRLRDGEIAYLRDVTTLTDAASRLEAGQFEPAVIDVVAARPDALGQLARVFQRMAREVAAREERLRRQLRDTRYVFMSYASVDRERVLPIVDHLEAAGVHVWLDRHEITGGQNYGAQIVQSIRSCAAVLVACSKASLESRNVRQEIQLAWKYQRPYVPLLLEATDVPDELAYWLEGWQWVDVGQAAPATWLPEIQRALEQIGGGEGKNPESRIQNPE